MPLRLAQEMLAVNVAAVTQLALLFLQDMKARNQGHIINGSSVVGSLPSQGVALYSATKSFIDTLTSSLYRELRGLQRACQRGEARRSDHTLLH